jgi:hypothetical protein
MAEVGVTWPREMATLGEGSGFVDMDPPNSAQLARALVDQARIWSAAPDRSPEGLVRQAFRLTARELGMTSDFRTGDLSGSEAKLYQAVCRLPGGEFGLNVGDIQDPRELTEIGVRLAVISTRAATLPKMASPQAGRELRRTANEIGPGVMEEFDVLEPTPQIRIDELGHNL